MKRARCARLYARSAQPLIATRTGRVHEAAGCVLNENARPSAHRLLMPRTCARRPRAAVTATRTGRVHETAGCVLDGYSRPSAHRMFMPCTCAHDARVPAVRTRNAPDNEATTGVENQYAGAVLVSRSGAVPHEPRPAAPGPPRTDRVHARARVDRQRARRCHEAPCLRTPTATEEKRHVVDPPPVICTGSMRASPGTAWNRQHSDPLH